jgi:hypothetical protein
VADSAVALPLNGKSFDRRAAGMERVLRVVAGGLLLIGVGLICFGLYLIGFALFTPTQPPPSPNEGHGMVWAIGLLVTMVGLLPFAVGLAIRSGFKKTGSRAVAVEPAVAADDRRPGTLGG